MLLRTLIASLVFAIGGGNAWAQDELDTGDGTATSRVGIYADDDETTVVTSMVDAEVQLPSVLIGAHVLIDSVSSASVDVVSAATERWTEDRVEAGARGTVQVEDIDLSLAFVNSSENDWLSQSVQATAARDFAQKNTRVTVGYGYTTNEIGRANDPTFLDSLASHTLQAGATQLLGPRTLVGASYTLQLSRGYQASPYRYVVTTGGMPRLETHPDVRNRHAVNLRLLQAVGDSMAWDTSYRFYADDWDVMSHTLTSALRMELSDSWEGRLRGRAYSQGGAGFYRDEYAMQAMYMSADRELSTFWDIGGGAKLLWHSDHWEVDVAADGVYYKFQDFSQLPGRAALVTSAGVRWLW